jgi:hypothetical protein
MPFTGDSFSHLFDWEKDPQRQEKIVNARLEAEFDGLDTGLSAVAARATTLEGTAVTAAAVFADDNRLLRSDGAARGAQASPVIVADTTGALSRAGNGGIPLQGTNTNDSAAAGFVGEYTSATAALDSVSLTTATPVNITSLSLAAGDWDVSGIVYFLATGTTTVSAIQCGLGTTTGAINASPGFRAGHSFDAETLGATTYTSCAIPAVRFLLAATTTVFLVARGDFATSTLSAGGFMQARRVR